MKCVVFRYRGQEFYRVRPGDPLPGELALNQFLRIRGVLCCVIGLTPEDDEQTLAVDVLTCSEAYVLEESLRMAPPGP